MSTKSIYILGIESSCDDTCAAVIHNGKVLSNIVANQEIHATYGGIVPELASRAHQQNIVPVVHQAIKKANIEKKNISAIAFTCGPGLMGSLLVGASFAKSMALALNIPLIAINHMQAHVLSSFINDTPPFPFLCLTVSGGHTQLVKIKDYFDMEILGETLDDAAGEAFDKSAKILGLPYPGGPLIDKYAQQGEAKYIFSKPKVGALEFSFSGLKTNILRFVEKNVEEDPDFIENNLNDICASIQHTIVEILMEKLQNSVDKTGITHVAIAGGVAANSGLRSALRLRSGTQNWIIYLPKLEYATDNAAMIGLAGYHKFLRSDFVGLDVVAQARMAINE